MGVNKPGHISRILMQAKKLVPITTSKSHSNSNSNSNSLVDPGSDTSLSTMMELQYDDDPKHMDKIINEIKINDQRHIFSGYLLKESAYLSQYRKRYMVLDTKSGLLSSYREHASVLLNPSEIFDLRKYNKVERKFNDSFILSSATDSRIFVLADHKSLDEWISIITKGIYIALYNAIKWVYFKCLNDSIFDEILSHNFDVNVSDKATVRQCIDDQNQKYHHIVTFKLVSTEKYVCSPKKIHCYLQMNVIMEYHSKKYNHRIKSDAITCKHMQNNPLQCPIYSDMKNCYILTKDNLNHLKNFNHFNDEYEQKPVCKWKDECRTFKRLQLNIDDNIDDICHMKLYRHPPRQTQIELHRNTHSFILNTNEQQNKPTYTPTWYDAEYIKGVKNGNYLHPLTQEVIKNGYEGALYSRRQYTYVSIMEIVDEYIKCRRHKLMGSPLNEAEMLSLILYTGCAANQDLCLSQRNGDYLKWKWFDLCLYSAIEKLSKNEVGKYKLYSGAATVKLDQKLIRNGYFTTYISSSWNKNVAMMFTCDNGILFEFDESFRLNNLCCDVSWISRYCDECEILFARSVYGFDNNFICRVIDQPDNVQIVSLKSMNFKYNKYHLTLKQALILIEGYIYDNKLIGKKIKCLAYGLEDVYKVIVCFFREKQANSL